MRCVNCREVITGEPVWVEDEPYCCQECADEMFLEEESEESFEEDYEDGRQGSRPGMLRRAQMSPV